MVFTDEQIQKVWEKATVVPNTDPKVLRKDKCGAWIAHIQYGNRNSKFGWEIDHITPNLKVVLMNYQTYNHCSGKTVCQNWMIN